ncbi:hypothetical protein TNCV_2387281 [Trichonephila clavipes]|nr:hypothetical protein TNCV_2387281 [Trichonephila clavipes]
MVKGRRVQTFICHGTMIPEESRDCYALFVTTEELQWLISPATTTVVIQVVCLNTVQCILRMGSLSQRSNHVPALMARHGQKGVIQHWH